MRRYIRALLLCTVFAVFSGLYVYNKLLYSDLPGHRIKSGFATPRAPGDSREVGDKTRPGTPHWYNRYIMRQQGQGEATGLGRPDTPMHLAVVTCGDRLEETLTMIKSAILFSIRHLHLHIFAEDQLHASFMEALESWPDMIRSKFSYTLYSISFPEDNAAEWKKLFKPCASQRLFLPLILKDIDSIVYVDSDILFLQPMDHLWAFLSKFTPSQLAAMAPEHEEPRIAWYSRFARHPFYGRTGVNSGVMLMNMTRMRSVSFKVQNDMTSVGLQWEELLMPLLQKYKLNITWGDQDLLNIVFHHNPERLLEFPCKWNYRPDHCIYGSNCASAEESGVYMLHGNRGVYHDHKQPAFRAVYEAIQKYSFGADPVKTLLEPLEEELSKTTHTYCGKNHPLFTKRLSRSLEGVRGRISRGR
ncbi:glucoside xylosyltransferase 1 isoform X1 [Takifugu rubripes]|uniref:glucoside xylosyltransferase 1 isoform X1 n=1 Tax=Takifugu rubripes TaxID=31033 RepID=UPI0011458F59|nr:glucoside xylosyltransferase 1 isoform X1 [Takifugu rubripes]